MKIIKDIVSLLTAKLTHLRQNIKLQQWMFTARAYRTAGPRAPKLAIIDRDIALMRQLGYFRAQKSLRLCRRQLTMRVEMMSAFKTGDIHSARCQLTELILVEHLMFPSLNGDERFRQLTQQDIDDMVAYVEQHGSIFPNIVQSHVKEAMRAVDPNSVYQPN